MSRRRPSVHRGLIRIACTLATASWPALTLAQQLDGPAPRVALVIGNSAYVNVPALPNPANDARLIAEKLWQAGFEVIETTDGDKATMLADIATFQSRLRDGSEAVFYYAGHGVQIGGRNYLLPTSISPTSVEDLKAQSIDAQVVVDIMSNSGAKLNLLLLDACRNNPFLAITPAQSEKIASRAISIGGTQEEVSRGLVLLSDATAGGLAEMSAGRVETMISFATAPGSVAMDGVGRHSPYTQALADNIDEPGLEIGDLFRRVRGTVRQATGDNQITWTTSTLENRFFFAPTNLDPRQTTTGMAVESDTLGTLPPERVVDRALWRAIRDSGRKDAFTAYLRTMPDGAFRTEAADQLVALGGDPADVATVDPILPVFDAPELSQTTADARKDALQEIDSAATSVTIGTAPLQLPGGSAKGGWFWVSEAPGLGNVTGTTGTTLAGGSVQWLMPGDKLAFEPRIGSNGGVGVFKGEALGADGTSTPVETTIETEVDACDMLAGNPYDSHRITAGTRQFIIDRNFDIAIVVCEIAIAKHPDVPRFWAELARSYRSAGRYEDALKWQQKAVDAGYVNAMVYLGQMYLDAQAVPRDYAKAKDLFETAASAGDTAAFTALAWIYRAGVGVPQDYAKAMEYYQEGASRGNDWAMTNIAEFYKEGYGVEKNVDEAVRWYTAAAKSGELTAQTRLARMYQTGDGVEQDFDRARFWFETSASRGVPNALTRLGIMYEEGQGTDKDVETAARLYTRAANSGDMEAYYRLGKLYASKNPLFDDPARAFGLLLKASVAKVYGADRELGKLYEQGRGVDKNMDKARELYAAAADNNPFAARDAGRAFASDDGVAPDFLQAAHYYQMASDGKVAWAALDLGHLVEAGKGTEKDPTLALTLYARALGLAGQDEKLASSARDAAKKFGPDDITRAAQVALKARGLYDGDADGKADKTARAALAAAFEKLGLPAPKGALTLDDLARLAAT